MTKLLLFLATEKGYKVLKHLYQFDKSVIGLVSTFHEINVSENFTKEIKDFCNDKNINFCMWNDLKKDLIHYITEYHISEAIAIGWRYIIPLSINDYLRTKLIIFHDSLLPRFRGFAPTPTAIICGEKEIGMSVLFAAEKMDEGPIIIQKKAYIDSSLYIKEIIGIQSQLYVEAITELIIKLQSGNITAQSQDESQATYSIWRSPEDCQIDWRLPSEKIYNLIRAVSKPYTGAFTYLDSDKIYIWKSNLISDIKFEKRDCGKIWSLDNEGKPTIVCGQGMLKLIEVTDENGNPVVFKNLRKRFKQIDSNSL